MEYFTQVVVWPGTIVGLDQIQEFVEFMQEELGVRVKYISELKTKADWFSTYEDTKGSGGRNDVLFYIHSDDIEKFAIPRFQYGMQWLEDVLNNELRLNRELGIPEDYSIYPRHIFEYCTW